MSANLSTKTFRTPFSRDYWRFSLYEMRNVRVLLLAALVVALRVVVKLLSIPVGPSLNITVGFFFNAFGSMVYGPVVALLTGAVSDTLGCLFFPSGPYFFPFIFSEMMGSFLFALFLYRAELSPSRVILSRFAVTLICNLIMDPTILYWQYSLLGKSYKIVSLPRVIKNVALFPAQCLLLMLFLGALIPVTNRLGLTYAGDNKLKVEKKHVVFLILLTVLAVALVLLYYFVYLPNKK